MFSSFFLFSLMLKIPPNKATEGSLWSRGPVAERKKGYNPCLHTHTHLAERSRKTARMRCCAWVRVSDYPPQMDGGAFVGGWGSICLWHFWRSQQVQAEMTLKKKKKKRTLGSEIKFCESCVSNFQQSQYFKFKLNFIFYIQTKFMHRDKLQWSCRQHTGPLSQSRVFSQQTSCTDNNMQTWKASD